MSPALPLLRDEVFLEEHRRIRLRLLRMKKFASKDSGFPTLLGSLVACADEIEILIPELVDHFAREERSLYGNYDPEKATEEEQRAEQVLAEHPPLLRELRALLESGHRVIGDLRASQAADPVAEGWRVYLAATVEDLLDHEDREGQLYGSS
jgi:hypothetical protein